jgi:GDPmannose 4,6-dehydratase
MSKKAFITGVSGQDGSYLAELLLSKGYEVHGLRRRLSAYNNYRLKNILSNPDFHVHVGDMTDGMSLTRIISEIKPNEIYNLAAQSHVQVSFDNPDYTATVDALGPHRILESVRLLNMTKHVRFFQPCSVEMFASDSAIPQNENTKFGPVTPYGISKLYSYWITKTYRSTYNMFTSNGIFANHESPRRGDDFVTKKIVSTLYAITQGKANELVLGNINVNKDWGHAKDFVQAMWLMLQHDVPDDYVIATGENHSIKDFIQHCCEYYDINLIWRGTGLDEVGIDKHSGKTIIKVALKFFRPAQNNNILGDSSHAKKMLGWEPTIKFDEIAHDMCKFEIDNHNNC